MAKQDQIEQYRFDNRTPEEQREIARQGGIRSGEVRREKATMKATLEMLLNTTNKNGKTYRELATLGLLKGAINGKAENYKIMIQLLGELQEEQVMTPELKIEIVNNEDLESVLYEDSNKS